MSGAMMMNELAASLLGQSWWAAPAPVLFTLAPVAFGGCLAPLTSGVRLPTRRPIATPLTPVRRGHRVIGDGHLEKWPRDVRRFHQQPLTRPARRHGPSLRESPLRT